MVDVQAARTAPKLHWLKWACSVTASIATVIGLGIAINLIIDGNGYRWSALIAAVVVAGVALGGRNAIAFKLKHSGGRRPRPTREKEAAGA